MSLPNLDVDRFAADCVPATLLLHDAGSPIVSNGQLAHGDHCQIKKTESFRWSFFHELLVQIHPFRPSELSLSTAPAAPPVDVARAPNPVDSLLHPRTCVLHSERAPLTLTQHCHCTAWLAGQFNRLVYPPSTSCCVPLTYGPLAPFVGVSADLHDQSVGPSQYSQKSCCFSFEALWAIDHSADFRYRSRLCYRYWLGGGRVSTNSLWRQCSRRGVIPKKGPSADSLPWTFQRFFLGSSMP